MKTFRLMLLGSVVAGVGVAAATDSYAADVEKSVKMYGLVNREVQIVDDGYNTTVQHLDNQIASSRFGVKASAKSANLTIGAVFEWQFQSNGSENASQDQTSITNFTGPRKSDISFSTKYGTLFVGRGNDAVDDAMKSNLSEAGLVNENGESMARGFIFAPTGIPSANQSLAVRTADAKAVDNVNGDFDAGGRQNRIRYDTPRIMGFAVQIAHNQGGNINGQINYEGTLSGVKLVGAFGAYNSKAADAGGSSIKTVKAGTMVSVAALHVATGLSAQFAWSNKILTKGNGAGTAANGAARRPESMNIGVGYQGKFFGNDDETRLSFQWLSGQDQSEWGETSDMYRVGVVHHLKSYGTDLYADYENISYDRDAAVNTTKYEDINVGVLGARVKF